jgi:hypothetical protein
LFRARQENVKEIETSAIRVDVGQSCVLANCLVSRIDGRQAANHCSVGSDSDAVTHQSPLMINHAQTVAL